MKIKNDEIEFHKLLQVLADQCNFQLSEATIELYDEALRAHGYAAVNSALKDIFKTRRGGDRFPSVAEIIERMGLSVSDRTLAVETANLVFWAFNHWRLNYCGREDFEQLARERLGDVTWDVIVRMGGYKALYKEWCGAGDIGVLRAQIRDAALAVLEMNRAAQAPALSAAQPNKQIGSKNDQNEE